MSGYDAQSNLQARADSLSEWGHSSSVWQTNMHPPKRGHVVEIVASNYVSRPCWLAVYEAASSIDKVEMDFRGIVDFPRNTVPLTVYRFFFRDFGIAQRMALKVQQSARNKRNEVVRQLRLVEAGGFHDKQALRHLFEIQQGRCYYSGDKLTEDPKNYVVDHIHPIYLGGTDWPGNLALTIKEINIWKGGLASVEDTLRWIAEKRGGEWLCSQKEFCIEVDQARDRFDREFQQTHLTD